MQHSEFNEIAKQLQNAKESGNAAEYNRLVVVYNKMLDDMSVPFTEMDSMDAEDIINAVVSSNPLNQHAEQTASKYVGITNVLNGIVSNTMKGKYSERDKQVFITFLQNTITKLNDIDADVAMKEKAKRIKTFSSISSRL